jgi:hypothetical protein
MTCKPNCGACCIAASISSPIPARPWTPGFPNGKPAGVPCPHLDSARRCRIFGDPDRPAVCANLKPEPDMCGGTAEENIAYLTELERLSS